MPFGRKNKKSSTNNRTAQKNMERLEVITNPKKRENNQECGSDKTSSKRKQSSKK